MHRSDEQRALSSERRATQQYVRRVLDLRERAAPAVPQRVRHLRARVATPHHLRGDLVAAPAEDGAPALRVALAHVLRELAPALAVPAEVPVLAPQQPAGRHPRGPSAVLPARDLVREIQAGRAADRRVQHETKAHTRRRVSEYRCL